MINFEILSNLQSWLALLTFTVLTVPLLKFCSPGRMKAMTLLLLLIRLLTNKSCYEITQCDCKFKFKNLLNKFSFILMIVIWSQSASILTKAFTGLLLNTYFNQKSLPIVETLQDIYFNKEILIATNSDKFQRYSDRIDESNELKSDILTRIIEFKEKFKYSEIELGNFNEYFFRKLIDCKMVFIMGSAKARELERWWKIEESYFQSSSHKYSPNYGNYLVAKLNPMTKTLLFVGFSPNLYFIN